MYDIHDTPQIDKESYVPFDRVSFFCGLEIEKRKEYA